MYTELDTRLNPALVPPKGFGGAPKDFEEHLDEAQAEAVPPKQPATQGLALLRAKQNLGLLADLHSGRVA